RRDIRLAAHVAADRQRRPIRGLDRRPRLLEQVGTNVGAHHARAMLGEQLRGGPPDARAGAGDDHALALEKTFEPRSPSLDIEALDLLVDAQALDAAFAGDPAL